MKIKTILLVCVLVMATNSMVYANEEKVRVGIRGTYKTYIETSSTRTVTFVVKETGQYRFFVENKSDSTVRVVGMYSKWL